MLEQETASIIKFVLEAAGNPAPYYYSVPQDFIVPSVFFPDPEIDTDGETLLTYGMEYAWYITFFASSDGDAHQMARAALTEFRRKRNLVPLIAEDGSETGEWLRVHDPDMKPLENGATQLTVTWRSRRPYEDAE